MQKLLTLISTIFFLTFFKGNFHQKAWELHNTFILKQLLKKDPFPNSEVRLKLLHLEIAAKAMFEKKKKCKGTKICVAMSSLSALMKSLVRMLSGHIVVIPLKGFVICVFRCLGHQNAIAFNEYLTRFRW